MRSTGNGGWTGAARQGSASLLMLPDCTVEEFSSLSLRPRRFFLRTPGLKAFKHESLNLVEPFSRGLIHAIPSANAEEGTLISCLNLLLNHIKTVPLRPH